MLEVETRFMIKEMYRKGISISEIARQTGHDRKTVRKAINGELIPVRQPAQPVRERKLDPYTDYLQQRMGEGVYNARKLYREIRERGYSGGLTQVILYIQPFRPPQREPATVRFETEPGQQAQVDWGSFGYINEAGRQKNLYCFVMTLGWSRAMYMEFTTQGDTASFMRCHQHAFAYFGGVPRDAINTTLDMYEITFAEHKQFSIPYLDFRGTPTGIDIRKVVEKQIAPRVNTGVAHKDPGVGQVGAGVVSAPMSVFEDALVAFADRYGF